MAPVAVGANAFTTAGDSVPVTGQWAQSFYDSVNKTTWLPYAGSPDASARKIYVKTYNHRTGLWSPDQSSPGTIIATNPNTDSHGEPGSVMDQYGYVHVFFGSHNSAFKYSYTTNPRDSSAWTAAPDIAGTNTVANPVFCNGKIYLFTQGLNSQLSYYVGTPSPSGGCSWSAEKQIFSTASTPGVSFGWLGNAVTRGTRVYFAFTYAPYPDVYIADCYFGFLETADGSFHNVNSSTVVAAASLPINRATAQANFLVFQTPDTSHATVIPTIAFDPLGQPHVMYGNGVISNTTTSAGSYVLYDSYWNGSAWTAGVQIGGNAQAGYFFSLPTLVATPTGIAAYWGQQNGGLEDAYTASWTSGGGWATGIKIKAANSWPISCFTPITNAIGQARVMFAESSSIQAGGTNLFGNIAVFAYGDQGFLNAPYGSPSGLLAEWPFDTATTNFTTNTTLDVSGNNVAGTLSNMVAGDQVTGQIAEALSFVNTGTKAISFGNNATIKPALPITVLLWYKPSSFDAAYNNLLQTDSSATAYAGMTIQASNTGSIAAFYGDGTGLGTHYFEKLPGNNVLLNLNAWNFVGVTAVSQNVAANINGILSNGSNGDGSGTATTMGYTSSPAQIAKVSGVGNAPAGPVDDMRIYNRVLAPWEISQVMWQGLQGHR